MLCKFERRNTAIGKLQRDQLVLKHDRCTALMQVDDRRLDKDTPQPIAREQWSAGLAAERKRLADQGAGKFGRTFARGDVERRKQQGLEQAIIERPGAVHHVANGLVRRRPGQARQRQIVADRRLRYAPLLIEHPPGKTAFAEPQSPLLVGCDVYERKLRFFRAAQSCRSSRSRRRMTGRRGCPTGANACRCRSTFPCLDRNKNGSARPACFVASWMVTARPAAASLTPAASPARPAPIM